MKFGVALPNFWKYAKKDAILKVAKMAEDPLGLTFYG